MYPITTKNLTLQNYQTTWQAMRDFTDHRDKDTVSELWVLQHPAVFTQGQAGKAEHILQAGDIPVIQSDRGGQVTYHGPGQLIVYLLLDMHQFGLGIRGLVSVMENALILLLAKYDIEACAQKSAPGVYVNDKKIASLGLRIRKGCSYHGLALNVNMDLEPFSRINPCGYAGLQVTQMADFGVTAKIDTVGAQLSHILCNELHARST